MIRLAVYSLFLLLSFLLVTNCDDGLETVSEQDEFGNTITYKRRKVDAARQGLAETTDPIGQLIELAHYEADTLHGQRILFYVTGDTNIVENYNMGVFDGPYRAYFEEGILKQEGQYKNNELVGTWRSYHDNGQLKEAVQFANNEENGPFVEYHPDGKLAAEGSYLDGDNEHGELKIYNENGELLRTMMCDKGRCQTTWSADAPENTKE
ncbi:MAG: toxin-antitoxin system YwqK family antitoxin [Bacteroidota bacterium]